MRVKREGIASNWRKRGVSRELTSSLRVTEIGPLAPSISPVHYMVYKSERSIDVPIGNAVDAIWTSPHLKDRSTVVFTDPQTGDSLTAEQVHDATLRLATILKEKYGIKKDTVVCLFLFNHYYLSILHHAILALGAIVSPANIAYNSSEISHQVSFAKPSLLVADEQVYETAVDGIAQAGARTVVVQYDVFQGHILEALEGKILPTPILPVDGRKQHAYYCFSSGTSGLPKCVITTHTNIAVNMIQICAHDAPISIPGITVGAILPMSHIFGLQVYLWSSLYVRSNTVVFKSFNLEDTLQGIVKYKIESMAVVPPLVLAFAKSPLIDKYPIDKYLRWATSGAAPLSKSTIKAAESRLPNLRIIQAYGQTETSPFTVGFGSYKTRLNDYDPGSIGWLAPNTEARLVDPASGEDAKPGERGELWVRGPQVMAGYLNNPEATASTLVGDGWLRSGDVCVISEDGQYTIVDRIKELIKSKGHQVAPAELEGLLLKLPQVIDSAVIGVYDDEGTTEMPRAYLVVAPGTDVEGLATQFNSSVAIHKRLWGGIVIVDAIPKSPSGKILRRELRDRAKNDVPQAIPSKSRL